MESRPDSLWYQGTRRYTRSVSNQEKEAKEKLLNAQNEGKSEADSDLKKKESAGIGHVIRGANNEVIEYKAEDGISYKVSDSAYVATERSDHPYSISLIQEIKPSKKDHALIALKWYYRPSEVPDSVYQMMIKDRLDATDNASGKELILKNEIRSRELFAADDEESIQVYPVSALRGKCNVKYFSNFHQVKNYELQADSFFYVLGYNPLTRRLTNIQGEVKIGSSHQWTASTRGVLYKAVIPKCMPLPPPSKEHVNHEYEELIWEPKTNDTDLNVYLQSARSIAVYFGINDGGSTEEGCAIASRDDTTIYALNVLFQSDGDPRVALQSLVNKPMPLTIERKWTEDQVKRFQKGLRQNGKNFYKIRKDHLPSKETSELVEFYYLWKKVQDSLMVLPQSKLKRQAAMKRNAKNTTTTTETAEASSSENDSAETDDSGKESNECKSCKHCHTTTSEDWDIGGKTSVMLCTKCRIKFKKYGVNAHLEIDLDNQTPSDFGETERRTPLSSLFPDAADLHTPPFMFKPIKEKLKESHESSPETEESSEAPEEKKTAKRRWKSQKEGKDVKEKRIKTEESEDAVPLPTPKTPLADAEEPKSQDSGASGKKEVKKEEAPSKPSGSVNSLHSIYPVHPIPVPAYPPKPRFPPSEIPPPAPKSEPFTENPPESEVKEEKRSLSGVTLPGPFPPALYSSQRPLFVPPGHVVKPEQDAKPPVPGFPRFPIPPQVLAATTNNSYTSPSSETAKQLPRPFFKETLQTERTPQKADPSQSVSDPNRSYPKATDHKPEHPSAALPSSIEITNKLQSIQVPTSSSKGVSNENPPIIEVEDDDSDKEIGPPILPEHHITLAPHNDFPVNFQFYRDGLPDFRRSGQRIIVHDGENKAKIASYPGFLCSRTDFEWVPTPRKDQKQKTQEKNIPQPRPNPTTSKVPVEKSKEVPRPKPKTEINPPSGHVTPNREPPRTYANVHMRTASHGPPHGRLSTSSNIQTPTLPTDQSKHAPSHSSPYAALGPVGTPAIEQLRQYANIDSQREQALSNLIPHVQTPLPFQAVMAAQSERDLHARELRERDLRERMPKQGLPKPFDHMDSLAAAMTMQGLNPVTGLSPGLLNPQVFDQLRYPGAVMGIPGAPQVVHGSIPGLPAVFPAGMDVLQQNPAEAERILAARALEQYRLELLHNHQHSHVHSHLHLHPQNPPPPGSTVFPQSVPPVNDAMVNPYAAANALALQPHAALAAGVDPVHAAASLNPMLSIGGIRPPGIVPTPGVPVIPPAISGADPTSFLLSQNHQLQAAIHENLLEQQQRAAMAQQHELLSRLSFGSKP